MKLRPRQHRNAPDVRSTGAPAPAPRRSTGSVYLDAPPPSRHRTLPRRRARGSRTVGASVLATVGLTALTAIALLVGVRSLVTDPAPFAGAVDSALDQPAVRDELQAEVAAAIVSDLVGDELIAAAAAFGVDVPAEATRVAELVLDDPAFRVAVADLVVEIHHRVVVEADPADIDLTPISTAVIAVIRANSPELSGILPPGTAITSVSADELPDLTGPMGEVGRLLALASLLALALPLALLLHPRRHLVLSWLGRWLLAAGLGAAVLAVALPYLGAAVSGWSIVEAMTRTTSLRLLAPAGIAGISGMAVVSVAGVARNRERRMVVDEGAAAALGVDEPALITTTTPAERDLARRGLVDVSHPLTNI